jgi:3-oxoacyl-[acyl-carrier protein] reductase
VREYLVTLRSGQPNANGCQYSIKCTGVRAQAFQADLSSYANVRALHAAVVSQLGEVDVLFNNSGVTGPMLGRNGNIEDLPLEAFEETWRTNTGSSFLLTQLCIPYMVRQQWGRIVFCSRYV